MAKVRVGTKRIGLGFEVAEESDDPAMQVFIQWVEINGVRFDADALGVRAIDHHIDGEDVSTITLTVMSHGYKTVDHRAPLDDGAVMAKAATGNLIGHTP